MAAPRWAMAWAPWGIDGGWLGRRSLAWLLSLIVLVANHGQRLDTG